MDGIFVPTVVWQPAELDATLVLELVECQSCKIAFPKEVEFMREFGRRDTSSLKRAPAFGCSSTNGKMFSSKTISREI
jgi:hypothetical protein